MNAPPHHPATAHPTTSEPQHPDAMFIGADIDGRLHPATDPVDPAGLPSGHDADTRGEN